jgi:dUTPase
MATQFSAGIDLRSREPITLRPGDTAIIPLGVKLDLTKFDTDFKLSHYVGLHIRSGLAAKGLIQSNGVGIIDLDYPKELGLIVHYPYTTPTFSSLVISLVNRAFRLLNVSPYPEPTTSDIFVIQPGERVAQAILTPHLNHLSGYSSTEVRDGGFGSTN